MNNFSKIVWAVTAIIVTVGVLWFTHRDLIPREVDWHAVQMEAREGGYQIIETDALWERYRAHSDSLLLVDTRQEWEYRLGHIAGAKNFPMEPTWLSRWQKKGMLKNLLGTDKERFIVFY